MMFPVNFWIVYVIIVAEFWIATMFPQTVIPMGFAVALTLYFVTRLKRHEIR